MSPEIRWRIAHLLPPIALAAIAAFYLSQVKGFSDPASAQAPILYGYATLVIAALVIGVTLVRSKLENQIVIVGQVKFVKVSAIFGILCGFIALIFAVGFYAAIPSFLLFFLFVFARMRVWLACAIALFAAVLVWSIFGQLLHMRVFSGYLL